MAGYKLHSTWKSVAFLYMDNEQSEKKMTKTVFTIAPRRIKYLGTKPTKEVKDLHNKN